MAEWGGARSGAGRWTKEEIDALAAGKPDDAIAAIRGRPLKAIRAKRVAIAEKKAVPAISATAAVAASLPAEPRSNAVSLDAVEKIIAMSQQHARQQARRPEINPFQIPAFPPGVVPKDKKVRMAMDEGTQWAGQQWSGGIFSNVAAEGLMFLGYPYLAELAQRPEYRVISETIATEMTRKWIRIKSTSTGDVGDEEDDAGEQDAADAAPKTGGNSDKTDKIKELNDELERLEVRERFKNLAIQDGFFGRSHLFLDFGKDLDDSSGELKMDIGNGRDKASRAKIEKGSFKRLQCVEAVWTYPTTYNAINPLREDWYNPQVWYVLGKEIHASRLPVFIGHPVPDLLKPSYSFGGLSLSQMAKPYVDIWLQTRESVAALIHSFSVMVLMTDLQTILQPNNAGGLIARAALFNALRDNQGLMMVNKATEDFKNVSASLAGLHELQAQSQEHMASVARIPLVKFTGISPSGLNASSDGEMRAFYDTIHSYQESFFRPHLTRVINFAQLSLWGEIDPDLVWEFEPLYELTAKEKAEMRKLEAETDDILVNGTNAISPAEVRARVAADPDTPYHDLDVEDLPEPPEPAPGEGGEGGGGAPGGKINLHGTEPYAGTGEGEPAGDKGAAGGKADIIPFPGAADPLFAGAADEWQETDHPRAPDGKFGAGGGSGQSAEAKPAKQAPKGKAAALNPAGLKRVGHQMGSNPGGVFEDAEGKQFYVKQPQSKAHVRNELLAASLYALAGSPTLTYRQVAGGAHVATEMQKLDKNRAQQLSPGEVKEAQNEFAVHAWLGNYDAVGTGGDNLGTVNGKPTALDLGGALAYRAQGAPKGDRFGDKVGEIDTMRDPKIAPDAAKIFGKMTPEQMKSSAEKVTSIRDGAVRAAVKAAGEGEEMADKLIARKRDIAARFGLQAADEAPWHEGDHPRAPDGKFGSGAGSSGAGAERQQFRMPQFGLSRPPSHFTSFKDWRREPAPMPKSTGDHADQDSVVVFHGGAEDVPKELNGKKFEAWTAPTDIDGWAKVSGQDAADEPPLPELREGMTLSSGVIIMEPDGRVWLMRPKGGYGGYDQTFPKGGVEEGLSPQANAIKEAYEETGIKTKILGFVGDYEGDVTLTRFYVGERETGDPAQAGEETDGVVLSPPDKLKTFLNRKRDRDIAALIGDAKFEESKHPRDKGGKFSETAGGGSGLSDEEKQEAIKSGNAQTLNAIAEEMGLGGWTSKLTTEQQEKITAKQNAQYANYKDDKHNVGEEINKAAAEKLADIHGENSEELSNPLLMGEAKVAAAIDGNHEIDDLKLVLSDDEKQSLVEEYGSIENAWLGKEKTDEGEEDDLEQATTLVPGGIQIGGMFVSEEGMKDNPGLKKMYEEMKEEAYEGFKKEADELVKGGFYEKLADLGKNNPEQLKKLETDDPQLAGEFDVAMESNPTVESAVAKAKQIVASGVDPVKQPDKFWPKLSTAEQAVLANKYGGGAEVQQAFAQGAATKPFGAVEQGKKTAFGGLWKAGGANEAENLVLNVNQVLSKPANAGQSYRQMLTFMIKKAGEHGDVINQYGVKDLKTKLAVSMLKAQDKATADGKTADANKIGAALEKIWEKQPDIAKTAYAAYTKEGGASKPPGVLGIPEPAPPKKVATPKPTPAEAKKAAEPEQTPTFPAPTDAEKEKAKKNVALQMQYVPGTKPETGPGQAQAQKVIDEFNEKYAGKNLQTDAELAAKVNDFKMLQAKVAAVAKLEEGKKAEWLAQQKTEAAAKAAEAKKKQAAEAKASAEKNKKLMTDLGINEKEALGFGALAKMMGGNTDDLVKKFQGYEDQAKGYGYPISGFQAALIANYTDGGYAAINDSLRSGTWTEAQHVYVKMVNKALKAMPTYKGTLKRGTSLSSDQQAKYVVGNIVPEDGFTSTSISNPFGGNTNYVITAVGKRAAHIKKLSNHGGENEVLFAARTLFKVTKVDGKPGGQMTVHMEEWDHDDDL